MIDRLVCQVNRIARECDRDVGHEVEPADRRCQRQRSEDVVWTFEGEDSAGTGITQRPRPIDRIRSANNAVITFTA